jgi:ATP-dependent protease ClpP protease subunit
VPVIPQPKVEKRMKIIHISEIGNSAASTIIESLESAKGQNLEIHIASPGGYVYEGIQIYNAIRDYKRSYPSAVITIILKGLVASMASYIACAPADIVKAEDNAVYMIHNPWSYAAGDWREMQKNMETLKSLSGLMSKAYAARSGKTPDEIAELMNNETWYFGDEILEAGFVDEIIQSDSPEDKNTALTSAKMKFSVMSEHMRRMNALLPLSDMDPHHSLNKFAHQTTQNPAAGGNNNEVIMNLEELKKQHPALYAEAVAEGAKQEGDRLSDLAKKDGISGVVKLKAEFKDSPLFNGINQIIDEALIKGWDEKQTVMEIARWSSSGTAIASLESIPSMSFNAGSDAGSDDSKITKMEA